MKRIWIVLIGLFLLASCDTEVCVQCQDVEGYPDAVICKDTWETTSTDPSYSWNDYCGDALEAGCVLQ